ncbi:MAG TPA: MBOAT family O-acyltransferase [Stellaceae bacterium]|nr:MBOAT family O-acyltransferase [Stellaceae bacterium]
MLFNSFPFLFVFLPLTLAGFWFLSDRAGPRLWFLLGASVVFYGYWDWRFAPLLVASILVNWGAVQLFYATGRRGLVIAAIAGNLLCLAVFKYLGFFDEILSAISGRSIPAMRLALPLGISFFTFHHIIYLADLLARRAPRYSLRDYALYIALFPQILAGPLVRHSEIIHQFPLAPRRPGWEARFGRGVALFLIGLGKKIFIADGLSALADPIFAKAAHAAPSVGEAWTGALAFPLQIYFDFSGYSDMAIGLALMLGFVLPVNFDVPYRATSLRDFWRRWHMTLSRFLRDYLYIPLGGNRHGLTRQMAALFATMALGGLWHGAGWTFIVWGTLHGLGLALGVFWRRRLPPLPAWLGWLLLMSFLIITWIFFRAPSLAAAVSVLSAMAGQTSPGGFIGARTILIAAAFAFLGPSSQAIVERLRPYAWLAPAAALVTIAALLKLGDGPAYEFIYFRF